MPNVKSSCTCAIHARPVMNHALSSKRLLLVFESQSTELTSNTSFVQSTSRNSSSHICSVSMLGASHRLVDLKPEVGKT